MRKHFKVKGSVESWVTKAKFSDDPTIAKKFVVEIWDEQIGDPDNRQPPCINSANRCRALADFLYAVADKLKSEGQP